MEITGRAQAGSGGRYMRQLVKHWSHKFAVEEDGDTATVRFPDATLDMEADDTGIALRLEGADADRLEALKPVVERHLDRFAFREAPLTYQWGEAV